MFNRKLHLLTLFFIVTLSHAFSCDDPQVIIQKPIQFEKIRVALTQEYQLQHYGIQSNSIEIDPQMIVLHWTCIATLNTSFRVFDSVFLAADRKDKLPGNLNVSTHFLVDRDGSIYQLMPETWMARHVIGLNHYAIGIENVGGLEGKDDLTDKQVEANAFLACYLKNKYPKIKHLIGHHDYLNYKKTALWLEKDATYETEKTDTGRLFLSKVKKLIMNKDFNTIESTNHLD